ncbi:peptidylprolyl isomerase [Thioalkalivibrio versutus]|uniref:Peptidyl-prolyl cis-trans isomerase n=2 Tax=Ectothiorhodospiraceae TaxID=72276 RepID=A0A0G3GAH3_9GAMM|nr:peptidylprolyl isomerase [Thioalkalivibrio versutus]
MQRIRTRLGVVLATLLITLFTSGALMADTHPQVAIETNHGRIVLELNAEAAPETVANFLSYVDDGFFDGTIFHRVIPGFMVQGGGFDKDMNQKSAGEPIRNEADNGLKNEVGAISMARTQDPHSATAQFFINVNDNDFLNHTAPNAQGWGYAVFGKVSEGMDVVRKIEALPTGRAGMHQDVPQEPVVMESVKRVED